MTRIALLQVASPASEPPNRRRERVGQMVKEAAGADMVVLPELWLPGYFAFDSYDELAEPLNGDTVLAGQEWAQALDCFLHLGSVLERSPDGRLHNTAVLLSPDGSLVHAYRKIHVFGYRSREAELISAGEGVETSPTPLGETGSLVCYDLRFPEPWRALVDEGAHTAVVPAAWPAARTEHWQLFTRTRAVEQQMFVLACNAAGEQGGTPLGGHSRVVDPTGRVLAEAGQDEEVLFCDVEPSMVAEAREQFPVLLDRHPV